MSKKISGEHLSFCFDAKEDVMKELKVMKSKGIEF